MRKISVIFLMLVLVLSLSTPALATGTQPVYSATANSGVRHQVCTSLDGTSADTYYTGNYTFDTLAGLKGDALLQSLRTLMKTTHRTATTYNQCRDLAVKTDCENGDGTTIHLLYTSYSVTMADYINNAKDGGGWNREHVWPKSLGGFDESGAGSDLHHIRPSDKSVNSKRGNQKYGIPTNGQPVNGTVTVDKTVGGYSNGTYFEPLDNIKGDVARICLYVYVRYGGELSKCSKITNVFQSVEVLLQWHAADPVDTWEMGRNEVVYGIQGNRNVFIDYPELAWLLFEQQIPANITTPSGNKTGSTPNPAPCAHANTTVTGASEADCDTDGYTGDTYCADCNALITAGQAIPATGEHTLDSEGNCTGCTYTVEVSGCSHANVEVKDQKDASCVPGYTGDTYCTDCGELVAAGQEIPANGEHSYGKWFTSIEATYQKPGQQFRVCKTCGHKDYHRTEPLACLHKYKILQGKKPVGCKDGYSGDAYCADCMQLVSYGEVLPATGEHIYESWNVNGIEHWHDCTLCGNRETRISPTFIRDTIVLGSVAIVIGAAVITVLVLKRKYAQQNGKKK